MSATPSATQGQNPCEDKAPEYVFIPEQEWDNSRNPNLIYPTVHYQGYWDETRKGHMFVKRSPEETYRQHKANVKNAFAKLFAANLEVTIDMLLEFPEVSPIVRLQFTPDGESYDASLSEESRRQRAIEDALPDHYHYVCDA